MKTFIPLSLALFLFIGLFGCGSDSTTNPLTSSVDFTLSKINVTDELAIGCKPNVNVKLDSIHFKNTTLFIDTAIAFGGYVMSKDTTYPIVYGATLVITGQKWTFTFSGKDASNNNAFTKAKDFTVP